MNIISRLRDFLSRAQTKTNDFLGYNDPNYNKETRSFQYGNPVTPVVQKVAPKEEKVLGKNTSEMEEIIKRGLIASGFGDAPIATLSAELARAGSQMTGKADPYLPTVISLMESRGLQDQKPKSAGNPYNIMLGGLVDYEGNPGMAIEGGVDKKGIKRRGFSGLMRQGGLYQDYLDTGDVSKFFNRFTPSSDPLNPSNEELVRRYNTLREYFK